ncbi:MAG: hypothetical protein ABI237_19485 [Ginsengibacter sp.]
MKIVFFTISFFLTSAIAFAQDKPASQWPANTIIIDGNAAEWNLPLKNYDRDTRLFFDIKNDNNNLYLCFQSSDEMNQAKIMRSGMKIILISKINGKHKEVIDFPLPYKRPSSGSSQDELQEKFGRAQMIQNIRAAFLASDTVMNVKGFTTKNGIIPSNDPNGIHASINWSANNTFTYEIAIPLKEMFGNDYNPKDISKEIALNVIINAFSRPQGPGNNGRSDGSRGMSEGDGRRMGEQGGEQAQEDRSAMFQKSELKEKFTLATHS